MRIAGVRYPTRLVDTNGNEIKVRYQAGANYPETNGSARIAEIEDVRAVIVSGKAYRSYPFNDAQGNLVKVTEPWPGGGADYVTGYTYSELGPLLKVTMPWPGLGTNPSTVTQTRTWTYDLTGSTPTLLLLSVAHPEWKMFDGTQKSTSFEYNADGTLLRKTDPKGQKIEIPGMIPTGGRR